MISYMNSITQNPQFAKYLIQNIKITKKKYQASRVQSCRKSVGICGWDLAHNAAGRVYTLALLYNELCDVEIIGSIFPSFGYEVWEPIRDTTIVKHTIHVEDELKFLENATLFVASHPYEIVHLSKPRFPNIIFGFLYKSIWGSKVIMDVDDEELALVGLDPDIEYKEKIDLNLTCKNYGSIIGREWTKIAVNLVHEFDAVTVSNPALQNRYGGVIIRHARNECVLVAKNYDKNLNRTKYGVPVDKKVVLFFGTPRKHKGLVETAIAIQSLNRKDVIFLIVGDFESKSLQNEVKKIRGCESYFIGNRPFESMHEILSMADFCVLLQDPKFKAADYQVPAKLTDALAMGIPTLVSSTMALNDFINANAVIEVKNGNLSELLKGLIESKTSSKQTIEDGNRFFHEELSFDAVKPKIQKIISDNKNKPISNRLTDAVEKFRNSLNIEYLDQYTNN